MSKMTIKNQPLNILITGGLGGIGRGIIDLLVARGDRIFVFDCVDALDERVMQLTQRNIFYQNVNIADCAAIKNGFVEIDRILSGQSLQVLINNAGITRDTLAIRLQEPDWDDVIDINLKGSFFCAQQALLRMIKAPAINDHGTKGYIINMASIVGLKGNPGQANYAASKAGLIALTKTLAAEYAGRNILVNALAPGFIQTLMTEKLSDKTKEQILARIALNRFGSVEDVAHVVAFLTSGYADYITGQVISIDGGML